MIKIIDGDTSGPKGFTGRVGKSIKDCEKYLVVEFKAVEADLPEINVKCMNFQVHSRNFKSIKVVNS